MKSESEVAQVCLPFGGLYSVLLPLQQIPTLHPTAAEFPLYLFISLPVAINSPLSLYIGEGDGTPLQYSCLENPMDGGAW